MGFLKSNMEEERIGTVLIEWEWIKLNKNGFLSANGGEKRKRYLKGKT